MRESRSGSNLASHKGAEKNEGSFGFILLAKIGNCPHPHGLRLEGRGKKTGGPIEKLINTNRGGWELGWSPIPQTEKRESRYRRIVGLEGGGKGGKVGLHIAQVRREVIRGNRARLVGQLREGKRFNLVGRKVKRKMKTWGEKNRRGYAGAFRSG